jgi:hypothetical protein
MLVLPVPRPRSTPHLVVIGVLALAAGVLTTAARAVPTADVWFTDGDAIRLVWSTWLAFAVGSTLAFAALSTRGRATRYGASYAIGLAAAGAAFGLYFALLWK